MLTKTEKTVISKKTITLTVNAANTVFYTVPAGKEFKGRIFTANSNAIDYVIGSAKIVQSLGTQSQELTLTSGTVLTSGSTTNTTYGLSIVGIEYDA